MASYRIVTCIRCGTEKRQPSSTVGLYCSNKCQGLDRSDSLISAWLRGEDPGWTGKSIKIKGAIRRYVVAAKDGKCESCGWAGVHPIDGLPLVEVDHVDGNPKNNSIDNLRVLCPNCHAMTPTFRRRNKTSPRRR